MATSKPSYQNHHHLPSLNSTQHKTMLLQLFLLVVFHSVAKYLVCKARNLPPSPFLDLPILGHLYLLFKNQPLHRSLSEISKRHGPITLLHLGSRRVLLVSSPSSAEECLSTNDMVFANRPHLLSGKYIGYDYTSLVCSSYGNHWRSLRKIASLNFLSFNRINMLKSIRADEVRLLVERLARCRDPVVNMKSLIFELMFNVMMRMIGGRRNCAENASEVEEMVREIFTMANTSYFEDFLPFCRWIGYGGLEKRLKGLRQKHDAFIDGLIEEHRRKDSYGGGMRETLIQTMLSLQEDNPEDYKDDTIRSLMLDMISAGTDTSTVTVEWALSLLLNHPRVLTKAQLEIDEVVGFDRLINEDDLGNLPYLQCIISETLRMYPPAPIIPHESSRECHVGGYRVPGGTMLLINVYDIQNDGGNWADASKFRPERFVGEGSRDHRFRMLPFGSGRRGCPGENLAMKMVGLALGSLIQCFDWERNSEKMVDMSEGVGLTMPKAKPLLAKCEPRAFLSGILV